MHNARILVSDRTVIDPADMLLCQGKGSFNHKGAATERNEPKERFTGSRIRRRLGKKRGISSTIRGQTQYGHRYGEEKYHTFGHCA